MKDVPGTSEACKTKLMKDLNEQSRVALKQIVHLKGRGT